jgi:hypothetical protein
VTGAHRGLDIEAVSGSIAAHAKSRAAPLDAAGRDFRLAGLGRLPGEGGALSPRRLCPDYHGAVKPITLATTMTTATREEFSSQAAPELLAALRQIADSQGRQFQAVLERRCAITLTGTSKTGHVAMSWPLLRRAWGNSTACTANSPNRPWRETT